MTILKNGKKTPWQILNEYPPALVRLLAKETISPKHIRALSDQEVAIKAELPLDKVRQLSRTMTWGDVEISVAQSFCQGCNFDPFSYSDRNRARAYSRSSAKFSYLKSSGFWESTFLPIIKLLNATKS